MIRLKWWLRWKLDYLWTRLMRKASDSETLRHGLGIKTPRELHLEQQDHLALMTALVFTLEALERSDDHSISTRASRHLETLMLARYHQHHLDPIRELPRKAAA